MLSVPAERRDNFQILMLNLKGPYNIPRITKGTIHVIESTVWQVPQDFSQVYGWKKTLCHDLTVVPQSQISLVGASGTYIFVQSNKTAILLLSSIQNIQLCYNMEWSLHRKIGKIVLSVGAALHKSFSCPRLVLGGPRFVLICPFCLIVVFTVSL